MFLKNCQILQDQFLKYLIVYVTGLVPNEGQYPIADGSDADLLSTGPMCRYSEDLLPLLKVYAGAKSSEANLDQHVRILK